jgi:hypothetical protein
VAAAAERAERVLMEGLHWRYHQLATPANGLANMAVLDAIYHAAGLPLRGR